MSCQKIEAKNETRTGNRGHFSQISDILPEMIKQQTFVECQKFYFSALEFRVTKWGLE